MAKDEQKLHHQPGKASIIIIIIMGFALLMALALWGLTASVNKKIIASNTEAMEELSQHDFISIRNSIVLRWKNMEGVAKDLSRTEFATADDLLRTLKARTADIPSATRMSLLDEKGTNYLSNGVVEKESSFAEVCAGRGERFVIRLNTDARFRENVREVLFAAVPVDFSVGTEHFNWLICQFPISTLENELKITSYGGEGYSSVIDAQGNYIINLARSHSFLDYDNFFEDLSDAKLEGYSDVSELFTTTTTTTTTTTGATSVVYEHDGAESIMVITGFDIADWYFISTVPVSVFEEQTRSITSSFMILLAVLIVFVAFVLLLSLRQRKQREEIRLAEAASKSKTEFLFNMSHDIRTPMNAILGYTDMALRHRDDAQRVNESLNKIKVAGGHLLNLINDILEMSRIESGKLEISEEPMDIRALVEGVQQMSASLAIDKSIDFTTTIGDLHDPYVYHDELHINEVLINLISNAVKYTPEGGKVSFKAEQYGPVISGIANFRFTVADSGIGMSEEFQQHLFEAFSREKTSTVSRQEGAGLGLSIVKKIIDLAGGTIRVNSKPNQGSVFTVEIPMRVMGEAAIRKYQQENKPLDLAEQGFSFEDKKVLLVEDNEMNREIATEILTEAGLAVETAEDGLFALQAVTAKGVEYYDFVLMDIQMPVMDGYEATKAIRALPGGDRVKIIALSANAFEEDVQRSLAAGMNAHVAKPIDVATLFDTMQSLA